MDYEKLHKDTIAKLQEMVNSGKITVEVARGICADFVPESEDEEVRKILIRHVRQERGSLSNDEASKCIEWLERQGEQKPAEWSIFDFRTWQYIVSDVLTKKDGIGQYLDSGECKKIAKYMQEEWGKKLSIEQAQEELPKGKDYGIDGIYAAIDILTRTLGEVDGYQTDDGILEHKCAISAVKSLYEQKPAWSGEDEEIIHCLEYTVRHFYEDEDTINRCCGWLKSLIPQNRWKPSDEQMNNK